MTQSSQYLTGGVSLQMNTLSIHDKRSTLQEGFSRDDSETGNPQDLPFQYFEQDPPYSGKPLVVKAVTDPLFTCGSLFTNNLISQSYTLYFDKYKILLATILPLSH